MRSYQNKLLSSKKIVTNAYLKSTTILQSKIKPANSFFAYPYFKFKYLCRSDILVHCKNFIGKYCFSNHVKNKISGNTEIKNETNLEIHWFCC